MSDPRWAHEFIPNARGKCKRIVGVVMCHELEDSPVHVRYRERQVQDAYVQTIELSPMLRRNNRLVVYRDAGSSVVGIDIWRHGNESLPHDHLFLTREQAVRLSTALRDAAEKF